MSDTMRKKWRSLRKKRINGNNLNNIEYSLRSNKTDDVEKENLIFDETTTTVTNNDNSNTNTNQNELDDVIDHLIQKSAQYNNNITVKTSDDDENMVFCFFFFN